MLDANLTLNLKSVEGFFLLYMEIISKILRKSATQIQRKNRKFGSQCHSAKCEFVVMQCYKQMYIKYVLSQKNFIEPDIIINQFVDSQVNLTKRENFRNNLLKFDKILQKKASS